MDQNRRPYGDWGVTAYKSNPGPHRVATHLATWHDPRRNRDVPLRAYLPADHRHPVPVIAFSHGLGSSRDGYAYLANHWASHGYLAVHPTHLGSDTNALRGPGGLPPKSLAEFLDDVAHRTDRPRDVSFVLDQIPHDPTLGPRADMERVAVAGHSYGAYVTHALIGLVVDLPGEQDVTFRDPRVRAAIVMSPQSKDKFGLRDDSWDRIDVPVLSLTGTKDIEYGVGAAAPRRTSFDRTPGRDQFLVIVAGATHAAFYDEPKLRVRTKPHDPRHHAYVLMATTAFLDAYLRDVAAAQQWLCSGALARLSDGTVALEYKNVTPLGKQA